MALQSLYLFSYVVVWATFVISTSATLLRFYSRAVIVRSWGWDDWGSVAVLARFPFVLHFFYHLTTTANILQAVSTMNQVVLQWFLDLGCGKWVHLPFYSLHPSVTKVRSIQTQGNTMQLHISSHD